MTFALEFRKHYKAKSYPKVQVQKLMPFTISLALTLSKLLKWAVHTLEIFCWEQDFCEPFDIELDEPELVTWRIHVEYSNGEIQDTESTNGIPDRLDELLFSLSEFFEQADRL